MNPVILQVLFFTNQFVLSYKKGRDWSLCCKLDSRRAAVKKTLRDNRENVLLINIL